MDAEGTVERSELTGTGDGASTGAGFWIRAAAQLIDLVAHNAIWLVAALAFGIGLGVYAGATHTDLEPLLEKVATRTWYGYLISAMGFVFYHTIMEWLWGATIGKQLTGLTVLGTDGQPVIFRAALGRSLAFYIDGILFGILAYAAMKPPLQQRLGDQWFGTVVVKRSMLPSQSSLSGPAAMKVRSFAAALGFALLIDSALYLLSACIKLA